MRFPTANWSYTFHLIINSNCIVQHPQIFEKNAFETLKATIPLGKVFNVLSPFRCINVYPKVEFSGDPGSCWFILINKCCFIVFLGLVVCN